MLQNLTLNEHWFDADGNPSGGVTQAPGLTISWQNGPLGRGESRREPNGAFVETVIDAARARLEFYQSTKFACRDNAEAIKCLEQALQMLHMRTTSRESRQVEGTHAI